MKLKIGIITLFVLGSFMLGSVNASATEKVNLLEKGRIYASEPILSAFVVEDYNHYGVYEVDFEPPTWEIGNISGQEDWQSYGVSSSSMIEATNPSGGVQHLRSIKDVDAEDGQVRGGYVVVLPSGAGSERIEVDLYVSALGGADYWLWLADIDDTDIVANAVGVIGLDFQGNIDVLDPANTTANGLGLIDSGTDYEIGRYNRLTIENDSEENKTRYYINGKFIHSAPYKGRFNFVGLLNDNYHVGDYADWDNVVLETDINLLAVESSELNVDQPVIASSSLLISVVAMLLTTMLFAMYKRRL